ncbi:NuA4-domain-containing protein [Acaromyces ingoldii]|uniref:Chromatin modification-related protein EAF6 n=1 Tax=Acaromyces ingoldii TaxID=215250 RepID=A0A316YIF8_9BASI|nr:NuA4-domain-containing protein [Acaromyces ingoldii]PWN88962.1 NuA4-domain-containing protein [Acaromyces ingoldii]
MAPLAGSLEEARERYESTKKALRAGITKKRNIDRTLTDLESQIFLFEGSYLASTSASGGNIVKGFDSYLKATGAGSSSAAAAAALSADGADVAIEDRTFSLSSATYQRSLELKANEAASGGHGNDREDSPAVAQGSQGQSQSQGGGGADDKKDGLSKKERKEKKRKEREAQALALQSQSQQGQSQSHSQGGAPPSKKKKRDEGD